MKFYSFQSIREVADCITIARDVFGAKVNHGRCNAAWRNGDGTDNVSIEREQWYDHVQKIGGDAIHLAAYKFNGDIQQAQEFLGDMYHLEPKCQTGKQPMHDGRFDRLIRDGYMEVARYAYNDAEGNLIHFVSRLEHPEKHKEFCQGTPRGWGLGTTEPILYNLAAILASPWCCIVEGEKCAETLISLGIPATTCCGGAKKWHKGYARQLAGKSVAILPDNDEPGWEHAAMVAASLIGIASKVKIVATSPATKGDAHDYITSEGNSANDLLLLIDAAPEITEPSDIFVPEPDADEIKAAKLANKIPFRNYIPVKKEEEQSQGRRRKGPEIEHKPRIMTDMICDIHKRFLGFPRKVGEQLFDHDRDTKEIHEIGTPSELFAWIGRKSKLHTDWARGDCFATKDEFRAGLAGEAIRYEAISKVPDWPTRADVYYAHDQIPPPCPEFSRFRTFVDFFFPASAADRTFLKALIIAPLWYVYGSARPSWIIDSEDGAGTGKSTIAEAVARLYIGEPIRTNRQELRMGIQELVKRLISSHGRQQRILLVDNVTGQFSCPELADLITAQSVSGRAPYGRGEETRPNNLTYIITANTATVDNDIADRSYFINVRMPPRDPDWKPRMMDYIANNRMKIVADIISILSSKRKLTIQPQTRFPEFERAVLQAVCQDEQEYERAMCGLLSCRADTNVEEEQAQAINDVIRENLVALRINPEHECVFIRSPVIEKWFDGVFSGRIPGGIVQQIRNLAKMNLLQDVDPHTRRFPANGSSRRSGIMWNFSDTGAVKVLNRSGSDVEIMLM